MGGFFQGFDGSFGCLNRCLYDLRCLFCRLNSLFRSSLYRPGPPLRAEDNGFGFAEPANGDDLPAC